MKFPVYLSYSGRNCEAVLRVMEALIAEGYGLLCDCLLPAHESFELRSRRAIAEAELVLTVVTEDAADCTYMSWELQCAQTEQKPVLFAIVEQALLPAGVASVHSCPVSAEPTPEEITALMDAVKHLLRNEVAT